MRTLSISYSLMMNILALVLYALFCYVLPIAVGLLVLFLLGRGLLILGRGIRTRFQKQ